MALPNGAADNHGQEIDLDQIEVEILIIARNPASLKATAQFLNRRGWPTTVLGNVQKALEFAEEKKPDFVLISFSHQNPAIHQIEDLVTKNYNSTCMAFVEKTDALSNQKLMQVKMRNKIFGQPSGPNFQRAIRKILSDRLNLQQGERSATSAVAKATAAPKREREPFEGEEDETAYRAAGEAQETAADITVAAGGESKSGNPFVQHNGSRRRSLKQIIDVNRTAKDLSAELDSGPGSKTHVLKQESTSNDLSGTTEGSNGSAQASHLQSPALGLGPLRDLRPPLPSYERSVRIQPHFKALENSTEEALKKVAVVRDELELASLTRVSGVAVFPVISPPGCGYLVLAINNPEEFKDREFFEACTKSLQESYKEVNPKAVLEPGFYVTIPEVDFDDWTADQAQFTFYWEHRGSELGVAFFESPKPLPKLTTKMGMVTVGIEDISTVTPLNFKAYLYMKMNRRYYLYLRDGRHLQEKQKVRLKSKSVNELFTKSVDLQNVRSYIASLHLAETIRKFKKSA